MIGCPIDRRVNVISQKQDEKVNMIAKTVILLLMILMVTGLAQASPHLTIKDAAFDFGFVPQHSKISHVFWLYSTGDDTLKITKVQPG